MTLLKMKINHSVQRNLAGCWNRTARYYLRQRQTGSTMGAKIAAAAAVSAQQIANVWLNVLARREAIFISIFTLLAFPTRIQAQPVAGHGSSNGPRRALNRHYDKNSSCQLVEWLMVTVQTQSEREREREGGKEHAIVSKKKSRHSLDTLRRC